MTSRHRHFQLALQPSPRGPCRPRVATISPGYLTDGANSLAELLQQIDDLKAELDILKQEARTRLQDWKDIRPMPQSELF